jgi:thymidylate kinase
MEDRMGMPVFIVEGVDGCGKSTLIKKLKAELHKIHGVVPIVIHSGKPPKDLSEAEQKAYQEKYFRNLLLNVVKSAQPFWPVILDRSHIGETVYAPIYRGYYPGYMKALDREFNESVPNAHFILLKVEDFGLRDDGNNFDYSKLPEEQARFLEYYNEYPYSKKAITTKTLVSFRDPVEILEEALEVLD